MRNLQQVRMPNDLGDPVVQRMRYLRNLSEIRYGKMPVIYAPMHLDLDEQVLLRVAHLAVPCYNTPQMKCRYIILRLYRTLQLSKLSNRCC